MKINPIYNGTIIGAIFTGVSLLLTLTFIVPILTVIPGALIESIMSSIVNTEPYSNVGKATIWTLLILLIGSLTSFLIFIKRKKVTNNQIVGIMFLEYFIIHSLGFYIYWATSLNFRSDGQLIFGAITSFPASSFGFIIIGLLIDLIKNKNET
jgi:hypothetical protein